MSTENEIKLMQFSKGSGCGCKIAPAILEDIIKNSGKGLIDANLLVGHDTKDDAAVFETENDQCIISTTDFFTPIVNDAYEFGKIAAANALSDVYAMGGKPLMAIAILGWPVEKIPVEIASKVLEGGRAMCSEAGIALAGGHSIDISEPVFGLAVTGVVNKKNLKRNNSGKAGDQLYITKAIGTGVLSSALKKGVLTQDHKTSLIKSLCTLNYIGEKIASLDSVHAMTDVTGFGLLGHLTEMTEGNNLTAVIEKSNIPVLPGFHDYSAQFIYPGNTTRNFNAFQNKADGLHDLDFILACDPQTNGGLLVATADETALIDLCKLHGCLPLKVGKLIPFDKKQVIFV